MRTIFRCNFFCCVRFGTYNTLKKFFMATCFLILKATLTHICLQATTVSKENQFIYWTFRQGSCCPLSSFSSKFLKNVRLLMKNMTPQGAFRPKSASQHVNEDFNYIFENFRGSWLRKTKDILNGTTCDVRARINESKVLVYY